MQLTFLLLEGKHSLILNTISFNANLIPLSIQNLVLYAQLKSSSRNDGYTSCTILVL